MTHSSAPDAGAATRRSVILDMDVGIDDTVAICYLAGHPEIHVEALGSVHGNVPSPLGAMNARRVLERCGMGEVPVAVGCWRPMAQPLATAEWVHGDDGLGNTNQPPPAVPPGPEHAVDQLLRLVHERPGELDILATGPLTNLGTALLMDPELPSLVRSVVIMGGAANGIGNASPTAEANIWHDPEAAELVFNAGWPLTMVGLDVTAPTMLEEAEVAALAASDSPTARFVSAILNHYLGVYATAFTGRRVCSLHDPLAAGILVDPSLVTEALSAEVHVSLAAPTRGMTVVDRRPKYIETETDGPLTRVAMAVDSKRFVNDLMTILTTSPANPG